MAASPEVKARMNRAAMLSAQQIEKAGFKGITFIVQDGSHASGLLFPKDPGDIATMLIALKLSVEDMMKKAGIEVRPSDKLENDYAFDMSKVDIHDVN